MRWLSRSCCWTRCRAWYSATRPGASSSARRTSPGAARRLGQRLAIDVPEDSAHPEIVRWERLLGGLDAFDVARQVGVWRGEMTLACSAGGDVAVKATVQAKGAENGSTLHFSVVLNDV